jgi:hypothetical protein
MRGLSEGLLSGKLSNPQAAMFLQSFHAASKEFAAESLRLWQIESRSGKTKEAT